MSLSPPLFLGKENIGLSQWKLSLVTSHLAGSHGYTMKYESLPSTLSENRKQRLRANNRNLSQCLAAGNSGDRLETAFQSYLFSRQF